MCLAVLPIYQVQSYGLTVPNVSAHRNHDSDYHGSNYAYLSCILYVSFLIVQSWYPHWKSLFISLCHSCFYLYFLIVDSRLFNAIESLRLMNGMFHQWNIIICSYETKQITLREVTILLKLLQCVIKSSSSSHRIVCISHSPICNVHIPTFYLRWRLTLKYNRA